MGVESEFHELFKGYSKAKGAFRIERKDIKGKAVGKAATILQGPTVHDWGVHLEGKDPGLGVLPLCDDNKCLWGAIDVDIINLDHSKVEKDIETHGLPLVVCRSKSGGAHLYVFFKEPTAAEDVVEALSSWAGTLGFGGHEIFPKQTYRANENDIGNWLNMPYFGMADTLRYCVKDGKAQTPEVFLEWANSRKVSVSDITIEDPDSELFEEGPPCLKSIEKMGGFPEGTRNEGMFSVCVYLMKRFGEGWADHLLPYVQAMTDPALKMDELNALVKSAQKKDYQYKCTQPPIKSHCNRTECLRQAHGVGSGATEDNPVLVEHLTRLQGDQILWFAQVGGRRVLFNTDELYNPLAFVKKIAEATGNPPDPMPVSRWHRYIGRVIRESTTEIPPVEDMEPLGGFKWFLDKFLTGNARCNTREELATREAPWYDLEKERVLFQQIAFSSYCRSQGFQDFGSAVKIGQSLRETYPEIEPVQIWVGRRNKRVWSLPLSSLPGHGPEAENEPEQTPTPEKF